jgi:hypothetical protein
MNNYQQNTNNSDKGLDLWIFILLIPVAFQILGFLVVGLALLATPIGWLLGGAAAVIFIIAAVVFIIWKTVKASIKHTETKFNNNNQYTTNTFQNNYQNTFNDPYSRLFPDDLYRYAWDDRTKSWVRVQ